MENLNLPLMTPLRIQNQLFYAKKFEVWSNSKKIYEFFEDLQLWIEQIQIESLDHGLQITVRKKDKTKGQIHKYIKERFYLDVAYALKDRILVCTIPETSNIKDNNSFVAFVNFAPFKTRKYYEFESNEPYCCSLFFDGNSELIKVSYSNGVSKNLIECT
jgi:hypothetical protein